MFLWMYTASDGSFHSRGNLLRFVGSARRKSRTRLTPVRCGKSHRFTTEDGLAECVNFALQVKELAQWLESSRQGAQPRLLYETARVSRLEQAGMGHRCAPGLPNLLGFLVITNAPRSEIMYISATSHHI